MKKQKWDFSDAILKAEEFDHKKWLQEKEKREKEGEKRRLEAVEKENERFDAIKCPVCKSTDKDSIVKRNSNSVIGPGSRSWITENYLVCMGCGVMYKDLSGNEENQ
jgi:hypothetical protein